MDDDRPWKPTRERPEVYAAYTGATQASMADEEGLWDEQRRLEEEGFIVDTYFGQQRETYPQNEYDPEWMNP